MKKLEPQSGQIMLVALIVLGFVLINTLFIIGGSVLYFQNSHYSIESQQAVNLAEAGVDKAIVSLNTSAGAYNGDNELVIPTGSISISVTSPNPNLRVIESTGYIPSKANPKVKRTVQIQVAKGAGVSFKYGVQVGEGGVTFGNSNTVIGSIYSNGNIVGTNNNVITGDAWVAGGTQPNADQSIDCLELNCTDYIFGKSVSGENRLDLSQSFVSGQSVVLNKVAIKLKKVGSPPNITVRVLRDNQNKPDKNGVLATGTLYSNLVTTTYSLTDVTFIDSPLLQANTKYWLLLDTSSNNSNYWVWQSDLGGSYSAGSAKWTNDWQAGNANWAEVSSDLVMMTYMGGVATYFDGQNGATVQGNVHANTIKNTSITKDAYYQAIQSVTAAGYHPNTADPPPKSFPISEAQINTWKNEAANSAIFNGDIDSCIPVLGPGKYAGNVSFDTNCRVTVKSPVWITGDFNLKNGNVLTLDVPYGTTSGEIIVDGLTTMNNGNNVTGTGQTGSILMILSTYDSRLNGIPAIVVSNTGNSGFLYADKGIIQPGNSNDYKELTAWGIAIFSNSTVNYESGLASAFFSSGPSGSYSVVKGTYQLK